MRFKLADDLKLRPREWSILRYLLSQFPNEHLFEAIYKHISLCLLNEKYANWRTWRTLYPPLKGVWYIGITWNDKNVTCNCVPDGFYFAFQSRLVGRRAQIYEKWLFQVFFCRYLVSDCFLSMILPSKKECFSLLIMMLF